MREVRRHRPTPVARAQHHADRGRAWDQQHQGTKNLDSSDQEAVVIDAQLYKLFAHFRAWIDGEFAKRGWRETRLDLETKGILYAKDGSKLGELPVIRQEGYLVDNF